MYSWWPPAADPANETLFLWILSSYQTFKKTPYMFGLHVWHVWAGHNVPDRNI